MLGQESFLKVPFWIVLPPEPWLHMCDGSEYILISTVVQLLSIKTAEATKNNLRARLRRYKTVKYTLKNVSTQFLGGLFLTQFRLETRTIRLCNVTRFKSISSSGQLSDNLAVALRSSSSWSRESSLQCDAMYYRWPPKALKVNQLHDLMMSIESLLRCRNQKGLKNSYLSLHPEIDIAFIDKSFPIKMTTFLCHSWRWHSKLVAI